MEHATWLSIRNPGGQSADRHHPGTLLEAEFESKKGEVGGIYYCASLVPVARSKLPSQGSRASGERQVLISKLRHNPRLFLTRLLLQGISLNPS